MRFYALAQRPWVEEPDGSGYWGLPPGTIGSVDLAPSGSQNHVFVTSDAPFDPVDIATPIGDGTQLDSYVPTVDEAAAWQTLVGVAWQPGWTLLDLLWHTLTDQADPDGLVRAKPIMPTHRGVLELHLGGHSLVRAETLPADPTTHPAWPNIQRVLQNDYRKIEGRDATLARKWLGAQQAKYRLSPEAARDLIVPADLPRDLPLPPTTTVTDDFNRSDDTTLGAAWAENSGTWGTASNEAEATGNDAIARYDTALSSDDHYVEVDIISATNLGEDPTGLCRMPSGTTKTYYFGRQDLDSGVYRIYKRVAGSFSLLAFENATAPTLPVKFRTTVDGSNLSFELDGVEKLTASDTQITGQLYCGLTSWGAGTRHYDNFEAADLVAGGATLTAAAGSFVLSGQAASLYSGRVLAADVENYALNGQVVALKRGARIAAATEVFTLTLNPALFERDYIFVAEVGTYVVSGFAAGLVHSSADPVLSANTGVFALEGSVAGLRASRLLLMDVGAFALSGAVVDLAWGRELQATVGSFTLSGIDVVFDYDAGPAVLLATQGIFILSGKEAILSVSSSPPNTPLSERIPVNQFKRPRGHPFLRAWHTGW